MCTRDVFVHLVQAILSLTPVCFCLRLQDSGSNINSGPSSTGHTRSSSIGLPEMHLITGHANGNVVVWDPSNNDLQPVLLVGPDR